MPQGAESEEAADEPVDEAEIAEQTKLMYDYAESHYYDKTPVDDCEFGDEMYKVKTHSKKHHPKKHNSKKHNSQEIS